MDNLVIVGASGVGRYVADQLLAVPEWRSSWNILGFLDDDPKLHLVVVDNLRVLGGLDTLQSMLPCAVVVAVGSPKVKYQILKRLEQLDVYYPTLIHPRAWLAESTEIGQGVLIYPNVAINHHVQIGDFVTINMGCAIGHDVSIDDHSTVAPQAALAGHTILEPGVDFGIGACTIQDCRIGSWSIVGAGAVVVDHLPSNVTAVGVPAQVIRTREAGWQTQ